jgi:signal transduction histidine kinase
MREIVGRIDALNELIQDLMLFARPRSPRLGPVDLRPLLVDAVALLRRDPLGQHLDVAIDGPDLVVSADAEMLRATVLNLLINAAQAMGGHGRIAITFEPQGDMRVIEVRDTGPGIPPDVREHVFEPFFTTKARGGGLGLAIARRTAELHGGTLALRCPDTGGTVVTLTLPVRGTMTAADRAQDPSHDAAVTTLVEKSSSYR